MISTTTSIPASTRNGEYLYFLSSRDFDVQMDFYEDNHVIANPYQVMAVQLQAGQKPPFRRRGRRQGRASRRTRPQAARVRIDLEGIAARIFPLPVPAGNYFFLRAGKGKVTWCSVPKFTEDEYEEIFKPGARTKWTLHIFDMKAKKVVRRRGQDRRLRPVGQRRAAHHRAGSRSLR